MTKLIATAGIVCASTVLMLAQAPSTPKPAVSAAAAGDAKTHRAFVNQYCVGCHNTRNPQPAVHPVDLEKASLDNVVADAATWERVLRKLSVRAMPPQGAAHPPETESVAFTTWLANSLDRAWASRGASPGHYVEPCRVRQRRSRPARARRGRYLAAAE
jgi:hypothetical protein